MHVFDFMMSNQSSKIRSGNMSRLFFMVFAGMLWLAQPATAAGSSGHFRPCLFAAEGAEKIIRYDSDEAAMPRRAAVILVPDDAFEALRRQYFPH